jgi:lipid A 3-O-deacylase
VQAGTSDKGGTTNFTVGVVAWPAWWRSSSGAWTVSTELLASYWSAKQVTGDRKGFLQLAAVPVLRYRFDGGRSPWFAEAGIGVSFTNEKYVRDGKAFSTSFNFYDTVGAGMSFGAQRENELGVRILHISNAGIKKPNPGENFIQLRYARAF